MERWIVYALLSMLFAGVTAVIAKQGLQNITGELGLFIRSGFVCIFVLLLGTLTVRRADWAPLSRSNYLWLGLSALTTTCSWLFYYKALKLGQVSTIALIDKGSFIVAVLLAWWLLGERFGWRTGVGVAVSFAGVLVLGFDPMVLERPAALFVMLGSSLLLSIGTVLMRGLKGIGMVDQQGWTAVLGVLPLLAISLAFEPGSLDALRNASWVAWGGAIYAALFSSLLGHGLFYFLVQRHPVATVTPYLLLTPVLAVLLGIVFWGDRPGPALWIGGAMVLGGVLAVAIRARVRQRPLPPAEEL